MARAWGQAEVARRLLGISGLGPAHRGFSTLEISKEYVDELQRRDRSSATVRRVGDVLAMAARRIPRLDVPQAVDQVRAWMAELERNGYAGSTRNKMLLELRAAGRWAARERLCGPVAELDRIVLVRVTSRLKPLFSVDELQAILRRDAYGHGQSQAVGTREAWHAVAAVLIYSGLRFSEVFALRWTDIDWSGKSILVREHAGRRLKTRRERLVPLQSELADILQKHKRSDSRVVNPYPNPNRLMDFVRRAGVVVGDRSPHSFRHSFASILTATGVPQPLMAAWLGHSSHQTTLGYAQQAARYAQAVAGWPRGEMRLMG